MESAQHTSPGLLPYRLLHEKELNPFNFISVIVTLGLHDSQQKLTLTVPPYAACAVGGRQQWCDPVALAPSLCHPLGLSAPGGALVSGW